MVRRAAALLAGSLTLGAGTACQGPALPHPLTEQSRYLCCNLHYEKPKITDVNYQVGTLVPFGTPVRILEVRRNQVTFQPTGQPPIELVYRYGRDILPFDQYLDRLFLQADPHAQLRKVSAKTVKRIEAGDVDPGMTREQVLMAIGYPPAHRTPSLEAPQWHYWRDRWHQFSVSFEGGKVDRMIP